MGDSFLKNAWLRALIPLLLMAIAGVTSNSLVTEITIGGQMNWRLVPEKLSFYVLLFATILSAYYQIKIQQFDRELSKGFTAKQYEAAIRNKVAEGVAKRSIKLIRDGNIEALAHETEVFKRLYGENVE